MLLSWLVRQAIYVHTGDTDVGVAEYTDANFSVGPSDLADSPLLNDVLAANGFTSNRDPGAWLSADGIPVDLMVPEAVAGPGRRGADLGAHGRRAARRAKGLEGALVDRDQKVIAALDPADDRSVTMLVAGPGALLVAKVHKIAERVGNADRLRDKDALDVLRLLQATESTELADRLAHIRIDDMSAEVTAAIQHLAPLFGDRDATGVLMAARAAGPSVDTTTLTASMTALIDDLVTLM